MIIKREVLLLDCPEIQCPKVLRIVFLEWCGAFLRKNIQVRVIDKITDIHDDAIVLLGDFIHVGNPGKLLSDISTKAVYIGWYWHKQDTSTLPPYFLHVHENVLSQTLLPDKVGMMAFMGQNISCPLLLRANEDPSLVGTYPRKSLYDYCFMGGMMCEWMVPSHKYKGFYYGVHDTDQYMKYEDRRDIYLSSTFALGFQTNDNIQNGHVSQRIFEAMAYGCVVLSHSLHASLQTEGIVEYVGPNRENYAERMAFFLQHPEYIRQKQQKGYEFVRKYGTNEFSVSVVIQRLSDLVK